MKTKVLILQGIISEYRVPIYNIISKEVDLTLGYMDENRATSPQNYKLEKIKFIKLKSIYINGLSLLKLCNKYDVIIFSSDLHYISFCLLPFINRKFKVIPWTVGIRASYTRKFDLKRGKTFLDFVYLSILNKSDACIFYIKEILTFWGESIKQKKIFIANNTVAINSGFKVGSNDKKSIVFIGTLYKEKKIYELITCYIKAKNKIDSEKFYKLEIIGNGVEFEGIQSMIKKYDLGDSIILHGSIFDEVKISEIFKRAIICVSPNQAGLSVLKSMGYGVPFITREDAITGGERYNIKNNYNGIFYNKKNELTEIIINSFLQKDVFLKMGINASEYYHRKATPQIMAKGVLNAIKYVL